MKLTAEMLDEKGACLADEFRGIFPRGCTINEKNMRKWFRKGVLPEVGISSAGYVGNEDDRGKAHDELEYNFWWVLRSFAKSGKQANRNAACFRGKLREAGLKKRNSSYITPEVLSQRQTLGKLIRAGVAAVKKCEERGSI